MLEKSLRATKDGDRHVTWNEDSSTLYIRIPDRRVATEATRLSASFPLESPKDNEEDEVDPKIKLIEVERERARLLNEIQSRRQAATLLQKRARGMEARKKVQKRREKARLKQQEREAAAMELQRVERGKRDRQRVKELKVQREKEWYKYADWDQNAQKAAVRIQSLARGCIARKKVPVIMPFQFAVGGYIFQHPGRKRPSEESKKVLRSMGIATAKKHIDKIVSDIVSPESLARAVDVPAGPGSDVDLMFQMFDINKDGVIGVQDLQHVFGALKYKLPPGQTTDDMVWGGDTDGDGYLSKEEFVDYMREVTKCMTSDEEQEEKKQQAHKAKAALTAGDRRNMMLRRLKGELSQEEIENAGLTTGKKVSKKVKKRQ